MDRPGPWKKKSVSSVCLSLELVSVVGASARDRLEGNLPRFSENIVTYSPKPCFSSRPG